MCYFTFWPAKNEGPPYSHQHFVLSVFWMCTVFIVVSYYFNLHFPNAIWYGASFHMLFLSYAYLLMMILLGLSFLYLQSNCSFSYCWVLRVVYIFFRKVFYQMCLANIFPKSVHCIFSLLILPFSEQKFLNFNKV